MQIHSAHSCQLPVFELRVWYMMMAEGAQKDEVAVDVVENVGVGAGVGIGVGVAVAVDVVAVGE